jgi:hypothetical protein
MALVSRQVTELLGETRRSVGLVLACPRRVEPSVASRVIYLRKPQRASRRIKPKSRGLRTGLQLSKQRVLYPRAQTCPESLLTSGRVQNPFLTSGRVQTPAGDPGQGLLKARQSKRVKAPHEGGQALTTSCPRPPTPLSIWSMSCLAGHTFSPFHRRCGIPVHYV